MKNKKYVLADYRNVFNSIEELTAELARLVEEGMDLKDMVVGTYVGVPQLNTSIAINIGGKVRRVNKSSITLTPKQVTTPPVQPVREPVTPPPTTTTDENDGEDNGGVCSFCGKPWVKKTVMEGFTTYLCDYHLTLETQLATLA